jgi:predicted metallopeptidase
MKLASQPCETPARHPVTRQEVEMVRHSLNQFKELQERLIVMHELIAIGLEMALHPHGEPPADPEIMRLYRDLMDHVELRLNS